MNSPYELQGNMQSEMYGHFQRSSFVQPQYHRLYSPQIQSTQMYRNEFPQNTTMLQGNTSGYNMMTQPRYLDRHFLYYSEQHKLMRL